PWRLMAPAQNRSDSARVVFPAPPCPTSATLRIWAGGKLFTGVASFSLVPDWGGHRTGGVSWLLVGPCSVESTNPHTRSTSVRRALPLRRRTGSRTRGFRPSPPRRQRRPRHRHRPRRLD